MLPLADAATAVFAIDAARGAVRDAEDRLQSALAQAGAVEARTGWVSPAGKAFREALAGWGADIVRQQQRTWDLDDRLRTERVTVMSGGGAG
jgi:hypothetical protein